MEDNRRPSVGVAGGDRRIGMMSGRGNRIHASTNRHESLPPSPAAETWRSSRVAKPRGSKTDPDKKRKKRIAKYKVYTVEGRMKASIRNSLRWIKNKCTQLIHGY